MNKNMKNINYRLATGILLIIVSQFGLWVFDGWYNLVFLMCSFAGGWIIGSALGDLILKNINK